MRVFLWPRPAFPDESPHRNIVVRRLEEASHPVSQRIWQPITILLANQETTDIRKYKIKSSMFEATVSSFLG
jgi:hypothetical protein